MAVEMIYSDLDLAGVSQLKNTRKHNVTQAQMDALAQSLGPANTGLFIYNTDTQESSTWTGSQFKIDAPKVLGAMVFKGALAAPTDVPVDYLEGYSYIYTGPAAALTWAGQTFLPTADIQTNDMIIYRGANTWDIIDGSDELATETIAGIAKRATIPNAQAGVETDTFVSPAGVTAYVNNRKLAASLFIDNVTLLANTPFTVSHNMNLQNKDAFTLRIADSTGNTISAQVTSTDVNNFTITSSVGLTGVKLTIIGF